jgi:adenosylhomocysteine nucleosidase
MVSGRLVTVDQVIRTAGEKAELRARTGADVVDMETAAVASVCHDRSQPFFGVRVVSDDASADLPPEVLTIMGPTGSFRLGATVGALWRRPASLKELWALREAAIVASDRLAQVLPALFDQLPG